VVIDGTVALDGSWTKDSDGKWATPSGGRSVLQLFIDGELQLLARYPNAKWSDKSAFYAVENWFRSQKPGAHNTETGNGKLLDQGACPNASLCCGTCNTHDLAQSGINATGALAVMNLWSCDTGVQRVTTHSAAEASVLRYNATWDGLCDNYHGGDGRYFVEGMTRGRALLDAPEEWLLDTSTAEVLVAERPALAASVRGRVVDYALTVLNASYLLIANLSFHAATLSVTGDVHDITLASLVFNYSAVANRSLGHGLPPNALTLWRSLPTGSAGSTANSGSTAAAPARPNDTVAANFVIDDVIVRYSDGPALLVSGSNTTLSDCAFEWNDWTVSA
jgi:hypothetical protein